MPSEDTKLRSAASPAEKSDARHGRAADPDDPNPSDQSDHPIFRWILEHTELAVSTLAEAEREHILRAMILCRGNVELAARRLGISKKTLYRRLQEYREAP